MTMGGSGFVVLTYAGERMAYYQWITPPRLSMWGTSYDGSALRLKFYEGFNKHLWEQMRNIYLTDNLLVALSCAREDNTLGFSRITGYIGTFKEQALDLKNVVFLEDPSAREQVMLAGLKGPLQFYLVDPSGIKTHASTPYHHPTGKAQMFASSRGPYYSSNTSSPPYPGHNQASGYIGSGSVELDIDSSHPFHRALETAMRRAGPSYTSYPDIDVVIAIEGIVQPYRVVQMDMRQIGGQGSTMRITAAPLSAPLKIPVPTPKTPVKPTVADKARQRDAAKADMLAKIYAQAAPVTSVSTPLVAPGNPYLQAGAAATRQLAPAPPPEPSKTEQLKAVPVNEHQRQRQKALEIMAEVLGKKKKK